MDGTALNDTLNGTTGAETINGLAGNDSINGNGGLDRLFGGVGNDTLLAGGGYEPITRNAIDLIVNSNTAGPQFGAATIGLTGGGYAIVWQDVQVGSIYVLRGQLFNANGVKVGSELVLSDSQSAQNQFLPSLTALPNGGFAIA